MRSSKCKKYNYIRWHVCFAVFFISVLLFSIVQMERYLVVVDTLVSKSTLMLLLIDLLFLILHQQNTSVMLIRAIKLFKMFFVEYVPRLLNLFLFSGNPADRSIKCWWGWLQLRWAAIWNSQLKKWNRQSVREGGVCYTTWCRKLLQTFYKKEMT